MPVCTVCGRGSEQCTCCVECDGFGRVWRATSLTDYWEEPCSKCQPNAPKVRDYRDMDEHMKRLRRWLRWVV